jgi:hypothetical protein
VNPFQNGTTIRHKLTNRPGVVTTRTIENPPRYLVLFAGDQSEGCALHHEIEANPTANPFANFFKAWAASKIQPKRNAKPEAEEKTVHTPIEWQPPTPDLDFYDQLSRDKRFAVTERFGEWIASDEKTGTMIRVTTKEAARDWCQDRFDADQHFGTVNTPTPSVAVATELDGQHVGPTSPAFGWVRSDIPDALEMSSDRRFYVAKVAGCGHYQAYDSLTRTRSHHFNTIEQAKTYAEGRARPAPKVENVPGIEWEQASKLGETYSKCKRFLFYTETNPAGGTSYRACDQWVKNNWATGTATEPHRYSPLGTLSDVKEWCEDRSTFNVNNTNGVSRLEDKSIPL